MQRDQFARDSMRRTGGSGGSSPCVCPDPAATWDVDGVRYYALDYDGGNDANAGFSDVSMAAAGAVAVKTWGALVALIPRLGAGRAVVVAIKPRAAGANYLKADGVTSDDLVWEGFHGYRMICRFGTTDFSNSATDQVTRGAIVLAEPSAGAPWTVAAGTTATTITVAGGETIPAEATILGARVRITSGALSGECSNIVAATAGAGGTITLGQDLSAVPANGVTFVIDRPGVAFRRVVVAFDGASVSSRAQGLSQTTITDNTCGLRSTDTGASSMWFEGPARTVNLAFLEPGGRFQVDGPINVLVGSRTMTTEAGTARNVGSFFRSTSAQAVSFSGVISSLLSHFGATAATVTVAQGARTQLGDASVAMLGAQVTNVGYAPATDDTVDSNYVGKLGTSTTVRALRVEGNDGIAGIDLFQSNLSIRGCPITNVGGFAAIKIRGTGCRVRIDGCTGSTGNTGAGVDLSNAVGCTVSMGRTAANTVTGTVGDVLVAGVLVVTHAQVAASNIVDAAANRLIGVGAPCQAQALVDGATISTPLQAADIGRTQRYDVTLGGNRTMAAPSNPTNGQRWAYLIENDTGARTITWTSGAGGFLFGLSIPLVNVVLGTGGAGSKDLVMCEFDSDLNRALVVGFVAGYV